MSNSTRIVIIIVLATLVGAVFALKQREGSAAATKSEKVSASEPPTPSTAPASLPRLVDLGAGKCIPCKMMAPILQELKQEYAGRMDVVFIDVWENRGAGERYGISTIPTQIFYDAAGRELSRHEGFLSKGDTLAKWKELGIRLAGAEPAVR